MSLDNERIEWESDLAGGPNGVADVLGQKLATFADSAGVVQVSVKGVGSSRQYASTLKYLSSLSLVESCDVSRVYGDVVEYAVVVRGDRDRLTDIPHPRSRHLGVLSRQITAHSSQGKIGRGRYLTSHDFNQHPSLNMSLFVAIK
jgi:hypothetical protein